MSKFVVVIFPSESAAYEGTRAIKQLHAEGTLTLYGVGGPSAGGERQHRHQAGGR